MALSKALTSGLSCNGCRLSIVRSFASLSGSNAFNSSHQPSFVTRPPPRPQYQRFSSVPAFRSETPLDSIPKDVSEAVQTSPEDTPSESAPVPWYLQKRNADPEPATDARVVIPPLPPNPPPLLETLLNHISVTLGLDGLELLDLRLLDPPPALGSKLIMIIGTARSEKHLHVSADRFCRWLRREHGLKANAAGLLGRNELKIKLRRKAKRMRLLANVGAQEDAAANIDDGIRTGWICVTLGRIPAHELDTFIPGVGAEEYVGFRELSTNVNVVVQMFASEEKRAEIGLERLWGRLLDRQERTDREIDEELGLIQKPEDTARTPDIKEKPVSPARATPILTRTPSDPFPPASWEMGSGSSRHQRERNA